MKTINDQTIEGMPCDLFAGNNTSMLIETNYVKVSNNSLDPPFKNLPGG
ncbi:MAG: hypothetical protein H6Q04_1910 [Acidobacteria bacterium]|jgi:hypothetical protein|nr:hypothetical protein [Acidobacteriota bacterium]